MKTTTLKFNLEMNKKSVETAQAKFDNDMNQPTRVSEIAMINEVCAMCTMHYQQLICYLMWKIASMN